MEAITLGQLLEAVGGELLGEFADRDAPIDRVDTDSRSMHPGALFIPLTGDRFDGHAYINAALEGGAGGCLTARTRDSYLPGKFYVKVEDTQKALRDLAAWYKNRYSIPFVAVTGSVGKTTAKDMLAAVLGVKYKDGLGQIDYLADIVKPDVGVITNVGDAHIERLGSRENILKAKCELLPHVKSGGMVVLNGDDALLSGLRGNTPVPAVFCGRGEGCEYRAQPTGGDGVSHIHCRLTTPKMDREVKIPALGDHMIYPALIAAAVGERFGLTPDEVEEGLGQFVPTRMRMNVLRRGEGITILDDTYNANPQSMRAAISVLADSKGGRKTAILGDMLELGPFAPALHSGVGEYLGAVGIDCLVAVGRLAEHIAQGARDAGVPTVFHCRTREEAKAVLPQVVGPDCTVLLKGSRGMKLEELTAKLLELTAEG